MPEAPTRRWAGLDGYSIAGVAIFLVIVVTQWGSQVGRHETLYLIGSRRVFDPKFLAMDFTWTNLSPTTFLFDHLLAPLWSAFSEFGIANIGRFVTWALTAWSLAFFARAARIPAWCLAAGFTIWIFWGQTLVTCGAPLEGFQVKSFAYPLVFFSLAFAMQGRTVRAGLAAGLGTAFHIVVGGWGCLAIFLGLLVNRKHFSWRAIAAFLLAAAPLILPVLAAVALFNVGGATAAERAQMDKCYVAFYAPWCGDFSYFMQNADWVRAALVFSITATLLCFWPRTREGSVLRTFFTALMLFFFLGETAQRLSLYQVLKVFPAQLALSLPALALFVLMVSFIAAGRPARVFGRTGWAFILVGTAWLLLDKGAPAKVVAAPGRLIDELQRPVWGTPRENAPLYDWIRTHTPPDSVFITPFLLDFWSHAERAQVASFRQPPLDRRIIEWKARLEALNGFQPFTETAWDSEEELAEAEGSLTIDDLIRLRDLYGATHYVTKAYRIDLAEHLLYTTPGYMVYDVTKLEAEEHDPS
jgi:hypothetical protein